MKNLIPLLILIFTLSSTACKKNESPQNRSVNNARIYKTTALNLALTYRSNIHRTQDNYLHKGDFEITVCSIDSFLDENDSTGIYVINFCNDSGWVLISADLRIDPIRAYNTSGEFGTDTPPPAINYWLTAEMERIEYVRDNDSTEPSAFIAWGTLFEDFGDTPPDLIQKKQEDWTGWGSSGCSSVNKQTYTKGPLTNIEWGQGCTYNDNLSSCTSNNTNCGKQYSGCVPTAIGTIMSHWNEPSADFQFGSMPLVGGSPEVSDLLEDIGDEASSTFGCTSTSTPASNAEPTFVHYGYNDANYIGYSYNTLKSEILNDRPVYLDGCQNVNTRTFLVFSISRYTSCHAWVCEGFTYQYRDCPYKTYYYNELFYMNWGWHEVHPVTGNQIGLDYNGWYSSGDWNPGSSNYQFAQDMICDIEP